MFNRLQISQRTAWLSSILVLFVLGTGIVGYYLRTESTEPILPTIVENPAPITPEKPTVPTITTVDITPEPTPMPELPTVAPVMAEPPQPVVSPLQGDVVAAFSVADLVFNPTMEDWRIHDGMDIDAQQGTPVIAASAGVVLSVTEDALMGTQVSIDHGDGHETTYANLQSTPTVVEGDQVTCGQIIGAVGTTSTAESALGPHLHFSVTKDGDSIDPAAYLDQ